MLYDEEEQVWLMLHSGSRCIGNTTAMRHNLAAAQQMKEKGLQIKGPGGAGGLYYLEIDSAKGQEYLQVSSGLPVFQKGASFIYWLSGFGWLGAISGNPDLRSRCRSRDPWD